MSAAMIMLQRDNLYSWVEQVPFVIMKEHLAHTAYKAGVDLIDKLTPGPRDFLIPPDASATAGSSENLGIARYKFNLDGSFGDAAELSKDMATHAKECNANASARNNALALILATVPVEMQKFISTKNVARVRVIMDNCLFSSYVQHIQQVFAVVSSTNAHSTILKVLNPGFTATTSVSDIVNKTLQNHDDLTNQLKTSTFPTSVSFAQLALSGLLSNLDVIVYESVIQEWNRKYPDGKCDNLNKFIEKLTEHDRNQSPALLALKLQESQRYHESIEEKKFLTLLASLKPGRLALLAQQNPHLKAFVSPTTPEAPTAPTVIVKSCPHCHQSFNARWANQAMCDECYKTPLGDPLRAAAAKGKRVKPPAPTTKAYIGDATVKTNSELSVYPPTRPTPTTSRPRTRPNGRKTLNLSSAIAPAYWDQGASVTSTPDFSNIDNIKPIIPFSIGGIGSGVQAIAEGAHPALPPGMNVIYHTPNASATLISTGYLCSKGCRATQDISGFRIYDNNNALLDYSPPQSNHLSPVTREFLSTRRSSSSEAQAPPPITSASVLSPAIEARLHSYLEEYFKPTAIAYHGAVDKNRFYTPEELRRADEVQELHEVYVHMSDAALGVALDHGVVVTPSRLTSQDVAINRVLRINCPQCAEVKIKADSYPPSTNQPADGIGAAISLDINMLATPASPGGFTHYIMAVDEKTGTIGLIGATSKSAPDLLHATLQYLHTTYTAYGHKIANLTADAEPVFESLIALFGKKDLVLTLYPPQQHAQRLERHHQTLLNAYAATLASIPFYVPIKHELALKQAVAFSLSLLPSTTTSPHSPYELRTGHRFPQHKRHGEIKIGTTAIVIRGVPNRRAKAKAVNQTVKSVPRGELGICMGFSETTPGSYNWLLESGRIEPRKTLKLVRIDNPFGFATRRVLQSSLQNCPRVLAAPAPLSEQSSDESALAELSPSASLPPAELLPPTPEPTDELEPEILEILSHDGSTLATAEFSVRWSDNSIRYHYAHHLQGDPVFESYKSVHFPRPPARSAPRVVVAPAIGGTRQSSRSPAPPRRLTFSAQLTTDVPVHPSSTGSVTARGELWTLVAAKKSKISAASLKSQLIDGLHTQISEPTTEADSTTLRRPKICLPTSLNVLETVDADAVNFHWAPAAEKSSQPALDDLAWYDPIASAVPPATRTAHLPFRDETPYDDELPSSLRFQPEAIARNYTSEQAFLLHPDKAAKATATEMGKYFERYDVCRLGEAIRYEDIPAGALKQRNRIFFREKFKADGSFDKFSARCYTDGSHQADGTYLSSYAGTCDTVDKLSMLAAYHARALDLEQPLQVFSFDVPGAFLQGRLTPENTPQECYIHFAADIKHPCAGKWYRRYAGTYGSKDANALFDKDFAATMAAAEFYPNPEQEKLFTRFHPTDPNLSCSVAMHVDDGLGCCTYPPFVDELRRILTHRYGELEWDDDAYSNTGFNLHRFTDGSFTVDQRGYIDRMLVDLGATDLPCVARPSLPDFFDLPADSPPVPQAMYRRLIGSMIYLLATKHNLRKEIQFLSTRQLAPTQSDLDKAIRVLAYINCHREECTRYSGSDHNVYLWVDSAYDPDGNGHNQAGYYITIGKDSGAVYSYAGIQKDCIAQGSMESEYIILSRAIKKAVHLRRYLHAMGFTQTQPITVYEDNMSAINLANAPAVSQKSKHIHVRYHLIRDYVKAGIARMVHVASEDMHADLLTKNSLPLPTVQRHSNAILNVSTTSLHPLKPVSMYGGVSVY